ncbi:MAG: hypothetical protein KF897_03185 [Opitutaceae bacterium]|nr:hypothetical protein [Opitutaceae bacterium]
MKPTGTNQGAEHPARVTFNLEAIDEIARKGIRRAAVFMGLGVNAAGSAELRDYHLNQDTTLHLLPASVSPKVLQDWKDQFRLWVVSSGFREVIDSLCRYFDKIHLGCSIVASKRLDKRAQQCFERLGLDRKIDALSSKLGITSPNAELVSSFYPIRNCLVHRLGRVGHEDVRNGTALTLRYRRIELVHTAESGRVTRLPDLMNPNAEGFRTEEAGSLGLQYPERCLEFPLGTIVTFSPKELTEILFFTHHFLFEYNRAVLDFAQRHGAYRPPASNLAPADLGAPPTEN